MQVIAVLEDLQNAEKVFTKELNGPNLKAMNDDLQNEKLQAYGLKLKQLVMKPRSPSE